MAGCVFLGESVPIIWEDGVLHFIYLFFSFFFLNYWSVCGVTCPKLSSQTKGRLRPLYPPYYFVYIFVMSPHIAACRPAFGICASNKDQ